MAPTTHTAHAHTEHAPPIVYIVTYVFLIIMMFLTVFMAKVQLGPLNNVVALGIALAKATAVVLFFMQVRYSTRLTWIWAAIGFIWLALMFGILGDYFTRYILEASGWTH